MVNNAVFSELMAIAGWSNGFNEQVTISGHDPVLPTRFQIGEMIAGIHAARGVAVSKLWQLKTTRQQQIAIDVRAATATLQSYVYVKVNGEEQRQQQAPPQQRQAYGLGFQKPGMAAGFTSTATDVREYPNCCNAKMISNPCPMLYRIGMLRNWKMPSPKPVSVEP